MEVWKDIAGYEGLYQISNLGRVKSIERWQYNPVCKDSKQYHPEKIKIPSERKRKNAKQGYLALQLYKDNKGKNCYIHRLVAEAFIPNPDNKETVNHINGDKHDNRVENLEWSTYRENNVHAYKTGLNDETHRRNCKGSYPVEQYDKDMNLIAVYPSMREAERQT
ncbi:NUMOD4 motif-containing HNH endonuclease, partial [Frisingicoccus sp.]|uniref:NUMOD4 motif-containing HNH endonuclease n=1 Tax=Frisingicoccus sp. TaxID=1918627 RepID=UPI0038701778